MKTILLILSIIALGFNSLAQAGKLKKADNYYSKLAYSYAAPLYEELIGSEVDSPKLKSKLASSYYNMGDMINAEKYYAQMISSNEATKEDFFFYAQALKQIGNYTESDRWMAKVNDTAQADLRGISFIENSSYVQQIEKQGIRFTINNLSINTAFADFGGYPSVDSKSSYFVSSRRKRVAVQNEWSWDSKRFLDLYKASVETDKQLSNAELITKRVNTRFHEGPLCFSPDNKTVFFTRNNISKGKNRRDQKGIQNLKLFKSTIDAEGKWLNEEVLNFNSTEYSVGHPSISTDGKTLYFASDMPGGFGGADIYKVNLNPDGTYGQPVNMGKEINTEGQEMFPWISSDGNLFFSSNGHVGLGGLDVFVMLADKNGAFGKMMNVGKPLNSQNDDFAFTMNPDNKTGYFSSNREGGKGDDDIYSYTLLKPFKTSLSVQGIITDLRTKEILPGATVNLTDDKGKIIQTVTADEKGTYSFDVEPELNYKVEATKDAYFDNSGSFTTINLDPTLEVITKDLNLEKDPGLSLYALITDKKSGLPLEGVILTLIDNMTGEKTTYTTGASGDFRKPLADKKIDNQGSYNFIVQKEGYFTKTVTYNTKFNKPGQYNVHEALDLSLDAEVKDLSELVKINPINFDLNKFNIRADAAKELDKIVEIMNKYPNMVVELGSHTDCRASIKYNETLSDKRAKASAAYIKAKITNPSRIYGKGYGESRLINDCGCEGNVKSTCSEEEHQLNRRTEFKVISTGNDKVKVTNTSTDSFK
ncbi:MAG: OmpA family protein [Crocinitomicaceae bacterium]|nr:OmpA family protein [Crocinitomicaceae bacterium]